MSAKGAFGSLYFRPLPERGSLPVLENHDDPSSSRIQEQAGKRSNMDAERYGSAAAAEAAAADAAADADACSEIMRPGSCSLALILLVDN